MNRKAFLLGVFATGGQVLLLRELVAAFNGDELFIGTALFGWLLWVALSSSLKGRSKRLSSPTRLFVFGIIVLPLSVAAARLSPLLIINVPGEIVPFVPAAALSVLVTLPVGWVSGALFPAIAAEGWEAGPAVVRAYLFEGIGAFAAGLLVLLSSQLGVGTLVASVSLSLLILAVLLLPTRWGAISPSVSGAILIAALAVLAPILVSPVTKQLDRLRFPSFDILTSFDTRYSRQALLAEDSTRILMTDYAVEGVYPDLQATEYALLPPMLYRPDAKLFLFVGRTEFGVARLADSLDDIQLIAVDPRSRLTRKLEQYDLTSPNTVRINADPLSALVRGYGSLSFDAVILKVGAPDNFRTARFYTAHCFNAVKAVLKPGGIVYFETDYDTDRYVSEEVADVIAMLYHTLDATFNYVRLWPGTTTLFFASDSALRDLSDLSAVDRVTLRGYTPHYVQGYYLAERLDPFKMERLQRAISRDSVINVLSQPRLVPAQAVYRAKASKFDQALLSHLSGSTMWLWIVPVVILVGLVVLIFSGNRTAHTGLVLFFTAGIVSLSLELLSFYLYQSTVGSLYSEMAMLIGTFMLGLALGAYLTERWQVQRAELIALATLLVSILLIDLTWSRVSAPAALAYYGLFMLTVAVATGSLFVAATRRYYPPDRDGNRGLGYAVELAGSAIGALIVAPVLLPAIGLTAVFLSLSALLLLALVVSLIG
jgi:spermidine synthase